MVCAWAVAMAITLGAAPSDDPYVVTPAREVALGERALGEFLSRRATTSDESTALRVARIGAKVAAVSDRPELSPTFLVVKGEDLQAFSFPGGTIALTESLMEFFASDDELAFVVAHELAHVVLRHHVVSLRFEQAMGERGGDSDQTPAPVRSFYARGAELEADAFGALYALRAGFAFSGASEALARLARALPMQADPEHPEFDSRLKTLASFRAELLKVLKAFDDGRADLEAGRLDEAIDRLTVFVAVFPNSFAGRVNLGSGYLGRARSAAPLPSGLAEPLPFVPDHDIVLRSPAGPADLLRAAEQFEWARRLQPDSEQAVLGLAAIKTRRRDFEAARELLGELVVRAPMSAEPRLLLGNTQFAAEQFHEAAGSFRDALSLRAGWSAARKNLALALEATGDVSDARDLWSGLLDDPRLAGEARLRLAALTPTP